jgi:biotin operon repressor
MGDLMMTEVTRKVVDRQSVWNAYMNGVKNGLTADEVAANLGMKIGTFNAAMNKLRAQLKEEGETLPSLKRKGRTTTQLKVEDMLRDLQSLKS